MIHTRMRWRAAATAALVAVALLPASPARADPAAGGLAGHLLDGTTPVANATVTVLTAELGFAGWTTTDGTGAFAVNGLTVGDYQVTFQLPGGLVQTYHERAGYEGDLVAVTGGGVTTVEETVIAHGSLAGTVLSSAGTPYADARVMARDTAGDLLLNGRADAAGHYTIPFVPAGTYTVTFSDPSGALMQNAHQKLPGADPDRFLVAVGAVTIVDEQFLQTGAVTGRLTRDGQPVAGASVMVVGSVGGPMLTGYTDADGRYRVEAFPGVYQVNVATPDGLSQWAHGKLQQVDADLVAVSGGADTVVDEEMLPAGVLTGRLIDASGQPVAGAQAVAAGAAGTQYFVTDGNGQWQGAVFAGTYKVSFSSGAGTQWAHGKSSAATANPVTVAGGQTVVVDESLAVPGSVTLTAVVADTGQPVTSFCAAIDGIGDYPCTQTGSVTFATVLPGSYTVHIFPDGATLLSTEQAGIQVVAGQNTAPTVQLTRGVTVTTVVEDAATAAPVANVCVEAVATSNPSTLGAGLTACSDAAGVVVLGPLKPVDYTLFAWAQDDVHGHQWVGRHGGVGSMEKAKVISTAAGQTVAVPPILMDGRATVTGLVTDKETGAPIANARVGLGTTLAGYGGTKAEVSTDATGRYTFDHIGPYEWTLFFRAVGFAAEWSGHTQNRLKAKTVNLKVAKAKTYNVRLTHGVTLTGLVTNPDGAPVDRYAVRVLAVNAASLDEIGSGDTRADGTYAISLLGKQDVKLRVEGVLDGVDVWFYYLDAADLATATPVTIRKNSDRVVNIAIPPSAVTP